MVACFVIALAELAAELCSKIQRKFKKKRHCDEAEIFPLTDSHM